MDSESLAPTPASSAVPSPRLPPPRVPANPLNCCFLGLKHPARPALCLAEPLTLSADVPSSKQPSLTSPHSSVDQDPVLASPAHPGTHRGKPEGKSLSTCPFPIPHSREYQGPLLRKPRSHRTEPGRQLGGEKPFGQPSAQKERQPLQPPESRTRPAPPSPPSAPHG